MKNERAIDQDLNRRMILEIVDVIVDSFARFLAACHFHLECGWFAAGEFILARTLVCCCLYSHGLKLIIRGYLILLLLQD